MEVVASSLNLNETWNWNVDVSRVAVFGMQCAPHPGLGAPRIKAIGEIGMSRLSQKKRYMSPYK